MQENRPRIATKALAENRIGPSSRVSLGLKGKQHNPAPTAHIATGAPYMSLYGYKYLECNIYLCIVRARHADLSFLTFEHPPQRGV